jgi:hypothetical protein
MFSPLYIARTSSEIKMMEPKIKGIKGPPSLPEFSALMIFLLSYQKMVYHACT